MPEAYEIHDAQFIQGGAVWSAANALVCEGATVPAGKVWTVLAAHATNDVVGGETQDYWFMVKSRASVYYAVTRPQEFVVNGAINRYAPFVTEGMEFKLFPGESLTAARDAATAGSAIGIYYRYIETDLPFYEYLEPQEKKRLFQQRTSILKRMAGGGGPASRPVPPGVLVGGGGRTRL